MHAHPLEARIAHVERVLDQVNERLGSIDRRLDAMVARFSATDGRFNAMDVRFNWVVGTIVATWVTMISAQVATLLTISFHR